MKSTRGSTVALKTLCHLNGIELLQATLTGRAEFVPVHGPRPDGSWQHIDSRGHFHTFTNHGNLPTLSKRTAPDHDDDGECSCEYDYCPTRTWYECLICGAEVKPRFLPASEFLAPEQVTGTTYTVEGYGAPRLLDLVGQRAVFVTSTQFGIGRVEMPGSIELSGDGPNLVNVRVELEFLVHRASAATGKEPELPRDRGLVTPAEFSRAVAAGAAALHPTEFAHLAADRVVRAALPVLGMEVPR